MEGWPGLSKAKVRVICWWVTVMFRWLIIVMTMTPLSGCWCCPLLSQVRASQRAWLELCVQSALPRWETMSNSLVKSTKFPQLRWQLNPLTSRGGSYLVKMPNSAGQLTSFQFIFLNPYSKYLDIFANYINVCMYINIYFVSLGKIVMFLFPLPCTMRNL